MIQINSSLSYVSTQAYSGAVPILERRSLIRRYSLLGIGASIRALNRIVKNIEEAFSSIDFIEIITNKMELYNALDGLDSLPIYKCKNWNKRNVDTIDCLMVNKDIVGKFASLVLG